jgi:hypothetical protein
VGERGNGAAGDLGKIFSLTRQAIINDDLDAFTKIPNAWAVLAIRTIGDLVYAILTGNPRMSDGIALFHADHKKSADRLWYFHGDGRRVASGYGPAERCDWLDPSIST